LLAEKLFVIMLHPILTVASWGFAGGLLAGIYPFIQASKVPKSQRIEKGLLFYIINFLALPLIGVFIACLAQTKCSEIDPIMSTFAGYAGPSLLQKWQNDTLIL
jgi:hypothetical protein